LEQAARIRTLLEGDSPEKTSYNLGYVHGKRGRKQPSMPNDKNYMTGYETGQLRANQAQQSSQTPQQPSPQVGIPQHVVDKLNALPVAGEDESPEMGKILFRESPFQFRRPPFVPSRIVDTAQPGHVPIDKLFGSQKRITDHGVRAKLTSDQQDDPILAYSEPDGTYTIGDGHHRAVAAYLRGDKSVAAKIVPPYQR
jgi:hypothetical protein